MNSFMKAQSQGDNELLSNLLEKKERNKNEQDVIWVREKGDPFCVDVELDRYGHVSHLHLHLHWFN